MQAPISNHGEIISQVSQPTHFEYFVFIDSQPVRTPHLATTEVEREREARYSRAEQGEEKQSEATEQWSSGNPSSRR